MEAPRNTNHNFLPRMFKAFTLYFVITLAVFFGYVQIFGDIKPKIITLPTGDAEAGDESLFGQFVEKMTNFQNVDANFNLSFENNSLQVEAQGNVVFDMETGGFSADIDLIYNDQTFDIKAVFANSNVYLSVDENTYKFDTSNGVDASSMFDVLSQVIDFSSVLDGIGDTLGIDLANLNVDNILSSLTVSSEQNEETGDITFVIGLGNVISAQVVCDENFDIKTVRLRDVLISGNSIKFSAMVNGMNKDDISVSYVETGDEIDMSGLVDYVNYAQNLFENDVVGVNVTVTANGEKYDGSLVIDQTEGMKVGLQTAYNGLDIALVYADNMIYVDVGSLKLSFNVNDFEKWKDKLETIIEHYTSKNTSDFVADLLEEYFDLNIESLDANEIAKQILGKFFDSEDKISSVLPNKTSVNGNQFILDWENGLKIVLTQADDILSNVDVTFDSINMLAEFEILQNGITISGDYFDLTNLLPIANIVETGIFEADFTASYNTLDLSGTIKVNGKELEISNLLVMGEYANIRLHENVLYFAYGNMKVKLDLNNIQNGNVDIKQVLNQITSQSFGVEIDFGVFKELVDMLTNWTMQDFLDRLTITLDGNADRISLTLENEKNYTSSKILTAYIEFLNNNLSNVQVNLYDVVRANLQVLSTDTSTIEPFNEEDYQDYSSDFVSGMFDSLKVAEDVYALSSNIAIRYSTNNFYGQLTAMLVMDENADEFGGFMPAVSIYTTSLGLDSYVYLIGKDVYVDINGLQVTADLSQDTIDEILGFVEDNFAISLGGETLTTTTTAFRVILPALDQIYGHWVAGEFGNGLQIDINDDLWYQENARFYDIVLQILIDNYQNTIIPTQIVVGANIEDENTTVYDDYSDAWLKNGDELLEKELTQQLNFAVYLTDIVVGSNIENLASIFVTDGGWENIIAVKSNYGTTNLADFNSYKTLLDFTETVVDYGKSLNYQFDITASIANDTSTTTLGGDAIIEVGDLPEGAENTSGFELFDGKFLKVQSGLDITAGDTRHLVDLLYESNDSSALYVTYSHGAEIDAGNKFRAKVNNSNLSEIISMLLKFANIDIGNDLMTALSLQESNIDFRFVQSLLGITENDISDDVSRVDQILSSVENITKMLHLITLQKTRMGNGLFETSIKIQIDINGKIAVATFVTREELQENGQVSTVLRNISVENLVFGENVLSITIQIQDFDSNNFDYNTQETHIDFSDISSFVDVAVNTLNTKGASFKGSTTISIPLFGDINVGFDVFMGLDEHNEFYLYLELDVGEKREITWTAVKGNDTYTTYNVVLARKPWDKRITTVEYKSGVLNIVNTTYGSRSTDLSSPKDIVKTYSYKAEDIGQNLMLIMAQALGLTNVGYDAIKLAIEMMDPNPTIEQAVKGFSYNSNNYSLTVNAENLTGMSGIRDITLNIGVSKDYVVDVDNSELGTYQKSHKFIDKITTEINIADIIVIPLTLQSVEGTNYTTAGGRLIYTNEYYRQQYLTSIGKIVS